MWFFCEINQKLIKFTCLIILSLFGFLREALSDECGCSCYCWCCCCCYWCQSVHFVLLILHSILSLSQFSCSHNVVLCAFFLNRQSICTAVRFCAMIYPTKSENTPQNNKHWPRTEFQKKMSKNLSPHKQKMAKKMKRQPKRAYKNPPQE